MRVEETFTVGRPPEVVFDYVTDVSNLADWQTVHTTTEQLTAGPPRLGSRFRERLKPPLSREREQVTEFTEFVRPRRLHVHIVEGRSRSTGRGPLSRTALERGCISWPTDNCVA